MDEDQWDGQERRVKPYEYQMRNIIREELKPIVQEQQRIRKKIDNWELGASVFWYFILATIAAVTAAANLYEWVNKHLK